MSILQRCLSYRESNKGSKEWQGPTLGVHFTDVSILQSQIKGVKNSRDQLYVSILQRCLSYRESNKGSKERQGPTLCVLFIEVSIL